MTQIKAHLMEKNIATNCFQVTAPCLAGWTKKPFGHYTIMKLFPPDHQESRAATCNGLKKICSIIAKNRTELHS